MKLLVLVLSLWAVVFARPDVSHLGNLGYHYKPPSTNYGVPVDNGHVGTSHQYYHHHHAPSDSYGVPLNNKYSGTVQINQGVPSGSYIPGNIQFQLPNTDTRTDFLGGSSGNKHEEYNPHLIQDQKHVYYYAVPDDEEPARLRIHVTPSNKKNTNVIFVKAPSYAPAIPEVIVPQHQAEEKTKVFVLVKKPEQPAPISIPAPAPVKSHPEVYVVKYENQDEAERVISGGRGGHPVGLNVHNLGDEATFVTALKSDSREHLPHNDKYSGFDGSLTFFGARSGVGKDVSVGGESSEGSVKVTGNVPQSGPIVNTFGVQGGFVKESDGSSFLSAPFGSSVTGSSGSLGVSGGVRGSGSLNSFGGFGGAGSGGSLSSFGVSRGAGRTGSLNAFGIPGGGGSSGSLNSFGVSGGAGSSGSLNSFGVSRSIGSSGSLNSFGVSGGVGSSGSFGRSGGVKSSGSSGSFGVQVVGIEKSNKAEAVVDSGKKGVVEIVIGDEKSGVDSDKDDSHVSGSFGIQGGVGSSSGVKNTAEIKTVGQGFSSPLFESFGKSALEVRAEGGERDDSVSESSLSGSITAGTEKSSVVDVTSQGIPFVQYGAPSSSGPY